MKAQIVKCLLIFLLLSGIFTIVGKTDDVQGKELESEQLKEWETQMATDYFQLVEWQDMVKQSIFMQLVEKYKCEGEHSFQLANTNILQNAKGENCEVYLLMYKDSAALRGGCFYKGILINYDENTSEMLFEVEKDYGLASLGNEFYDMQITDLDGNGEEDIILLLGEHRHQGAEYYIPDIYGLIGLQNNGKFQFVNCHKEKWLDEILYSLYKEEHDNRKIQNIMEDLKKHFQNTNSDKIKDNEKTLEDYIHKKEENIIKKLDQRSLVINREELWEYLYVNEDNQIRKIMVCIEDGEPGLAPVEQISVYVYDYQTEEAEKQIVPDIYEDICDEYGFSTEIELEDLIYEDQNGDGEKDITITIVVTNGEQGKDKKQSRYKIVYYSGMYQENNMKIFTKVSVTEVGTNEPLR